MPSNSPDSGNGLRLEFARALAAVLAQTQLEQLDLACMWLACAFLRVLFVALTLRTACCFNFPDNMLKGEGVCVLASALPHAQLKVLHVCSKSHVVRGRPRLHSRSNISIPSDNGLGMDGTRALAAVLPQTRLEVLSLRWNDLGLDSARVLAAVLPRTWQLTGLDVSCTLFFVFGSDFLACRLTRSAADNELGEDGCAVLESVLAHTQLHYLARTSPT